MADATNSPSDGGNNATDANEPDVKDNKGSKTFTQDELGQRLSEERKKLRADFEKEKADALADAKAKWDHDAKLTEEERAKEAREAERKKLDERELSITMRERRADAIEKLNEKGIPSKLVDFVVDADADKTDENIATLEKEFNKAVEEGVKAKLSGTTPGDPSATSKGNKPADNVAKGTYNKNGYHAF